MALDILSSTFHTLIDDSAVGPALGFTVLQAGLSAFLSVGLALLCAPGYAFLKNLGVTNRRGEAVPFKIFRSLLLLPNFVSPLLTVICLLSTFGTFPYGWTGILVGHIFLNFGLCTVWIGEKWSELENHWAFVTKVQGAGFWQTVFKIYLPLLAPVLRAAFAVVFSFCTMSFAIPLVLGGSPRFSTLEVLVFEKLNALGDPKAALALSALQVVLQFSVLFLVMRPFPRQLNSRRPLFNSKNIFRLRGSFIALPLIIFFGLALVPFIELFLTAHSSSWLFINTSDFLAALKLSILAAFGTSVICGSLIVFLTLHKGSPFLVRVPVLSGVTVGMILFLATRFGFSSVNTHFFFHVFLLVLGQSAVIFLPLLRLAEPAMEDIRANYGRTVKQLGVGVWLALRKVYWPLSRRVWISAIALAACWSLGEFSVAMIFSRDFPTLPLLIEQMAGSYRLEQAALISIVLLLLSFVTLYCGDVVYEN